MSGSIARRVVVGFSMIVGVVRPAIAAAPDAAAVWWQQGASIGGTVVDDRGVPVAGARIALVGTARATASDVRGRFRLDALTGTSVQIRVSAIGYAPQVQTVSVGTADVAIKLAPTVFALSDVIITGTAGGEEKRTLGNTVATVQASEVQQIAPSVDLSQMINGRASNVVLQDQAGAAGAGGKFRIRGTSSISVSNDPLIYIDGVRADNSVGQGTTFASTSRFNDIDPNNIESIEIIKGPAAATLYGTEASAGVIQIITKKGRQGRSEINFETGQGNSWVWNPEGLFDKTLSYYKDASGTIHSYSVVRQESDSGRPIFRDGYRQRYAIDAKGGNAALQYFVAGSYDDENGVVQTNQVKRWNGRANVQATISPTLTVSVNAGYVSSNDGIPDFELMRGVYMPFPAFIGTPARGFLTYPPEVSYQALKITESVTRTTLGFSMNHSPTRWFNHRITVGVDDVNQNTETLRPFLTGFAAAFFSPTADLGSDTLNLRLARFTTVDYGATATADLTKKIQSKTSVGFQYYRKYQNFLTLGGKGFPAPGVSTVSSAAANGAAGTPIENRTAGVYGQEQISFNNRLFLTGALRADQNSAFGQNLGFVYYPKVSASWVMSDEPFFPKDLFSTFRLRAAYGKSGQQPDQFAALRSYQAVPGPLGLPAVRPQFVGNPDLGPEKGRELEAGVEIGLKGDRIGLDFTVFDKKIDNAILARNVAPSLGFPAVQFANLAAISNKGIEAQLNVTPVSSKSLKVDLNFSVSHTINKIDDMSGITNLTAGINQFQRVGFPIASFYALKVLSAELGPNGQPINIMCDAGDGNSNPTGVAVPCAQAPSVFMVGSPGTELEFAL